MDEEEYEYKAIFYSAANVVTSEREVCGDWSDVTDFLADLSSDLEDLAPGERIELKRIK